jgi:hypothetical protein
MEAAGLFEKLLMIYQTPRHHISEHDNLEGKYCLGKERVTMLKWLEVMTKPSVTF